MSRHFLKVCLQIWCHGDLTVCTVYGVSKQSCLIQRFYMDVVESNIPLCAPSCLLEGLMDTQADRVCAVHTSDGCARCCCGEGLNCPTCHRAVALGNLLLCSAREDILLEPQTPAGFDWQTLKDLLVKKGERLAAPETNISPRSWQRWKNRAKRE